MGLRKTSHADIIAAIVLILLLGKPFAGLFPATRPMTRMFSWQRTVPGHVHSAANWITFRRQ